MVEIQAINKARIEAKAGGPWAMRLVEWLDKGSGTPWVMRADVGGRLRPDRTESAQQMPELFTALSWRLVSIDAAGVETVRKQLSISDVPLYRAQADYPGGEPVYAWVLQVHMAGAGQSRVVTLEWQAVAWDVDQNNPMGSQKLYAEQGSTDGGDSGIMRTHVLNDFSNGQTWAIDVVMAGQSAPWHTDEAGAWLGTVPGAEAYATSEGGTLVVSIPGSAGQ